MTQQDICSQTCSYSIMKVWFRNCTSFSVKMTDLHYMQLVAGLV